MDDHIGGLTFRLEGVVRDRSEPGDFEGPLSLILMLLSKNKIEIRDIKIADILEQYTDYLAQMQKLDLEIASEFVQMAAYLLYIKTRTLLTTDEEPDELEQLMTSLEQLKCRELRESLRTVLPQLSEASEQGFRLFVRAQEPLSSEARSYDYRHEPEELLRSLYAVFSRSGAKPPEPVLHNDYVPRRIVYSVRDKCREILERLDGAAKTSLSALYASGGSRSEIVATFLSILELCALGSLRISREDGEYYVTGCGGDAEKILESIEE